MKLYLRGHSYRYAMEQIQLSLFPEAPMEYVEAPFSDGDGAVSTLTTGPVYTTAATVITVGSRTSRAMRRAKTEALDERLVRQLLRQSYYKAALPLLPAEPAWGALSGVRPTKLTTKHLLDGGTPASADRMLRDVYYVTPSRRKLAVACSQATVDAAARLAPNDISLYVGIPFCPTRCAYCSFVSQTTEKDGWMLDEYLTALLEEIRYTGQLMKQSGLRIRTLYIGGGTPTTLSTLQLQRLMATLAVSFDLSGLLEYTVEGGRPDTLDFEKLRAIRKLGADRMSINPQTMSDQVLQNVGRRHTTAETLAAFSAARAAGFDGINMDLIAGLPGDTAAGFAQSLGQVLALHPTNITIHTLALKKGAALFEKRAALPSAAAVETMLRDAEARLRKEGYLPYYLYRQKYMSGSFENVGWCKPGYAGLYNIYMMEELHTVLSLGAGGMSKINLPGGKLVRFHNPKYPKEYIAAGEKLRAQKDEVFSILAANRPVSGRG
jgi:oxygen-independent coproporphyrinogen-3 oxidase